MSPLIIITCTSSSLHSLIIISPTSLSLSWSVCVCLSLCLFTEYYICIGEKRTTMNVHLLSHLADCVRRWGPVWAYSCFVYETMNGHLKKLFHGTKNMSKQVCYHNNTYTVLWKFNFCWCKIGIKIPWLYNFHAFSM